MHDPQQTLSSYTAFAGAANPFSPGPIGFYPTTWHPGAVNPLAAIAQTGVGNPFAQQNPFGMQQGYGSIPNYAAAQQLQQLASILAAQQGLQQQQPFGIPAQGNPMQHQQAAQNQIVAAILQNPVLAQQLALQAVAQQYGQQQIGQNPYGQNWGMPQIGQQSGPQFGQNPYGLAGIQTGLGQSAFQLAPQSWVGQTGLPQFGGRGIY
ncbi:MAG TPA: hypothetical protein VG345_07310 [Bryobacteraceae bacterium]|jgi:hypothetical protein|nr:hypothetical protein [Bryobacteraceae bacterium]